MQRSVVGFVVFSLFCISIFSESESAGASPVQVSYTRSGIQWSVLVPSAGLVLTVSGPDRLYWKQEYGPNSRPNFAPLDEQGMVRPEGAYRWELVVELNAVPGEDQVKEPNPVVSGSFEIQHGQIISRPDNEQPVVVEEGAPANSLFLDREGRVGVGTSVPDSQLHLKGSDPAFTLEDTTSGGRPYSLRSLERGDGSLGLFDEKTGRARWLVDSEGRLGIGTDKPASTLTVDGYIEATKGFLVNGRPVQTGFFGGGASLLSTEGGSNNFFGTGAGASNTTGTNNAFFGGNAGYSNTTGQQNSFFGTDTGYDNTTGNFNSFFGSFAGVENTTGHDNSIFGSWAGHDNTVGYNNSFFGNGAARLNTEGHDNSFFGTAAGNWNTTGNSNSFFGSNAGRLNTTASGNSFFGGSAGYNNTGGQNSFFGMTAGYSNTTGSGNSFFGSSVGYSNTEGVANSFFGASAGYNNSSGHRNSFFGFSAGSANTTGSDNSFFGRAAGSDNITGGANSFFGGLAGQVNTTGSNNSFFGYSAGQLNQTGYGNSAFGTVAGFSNIQGIQNSFFGWAAGYHNTVEERNTFVGYAADLNPGANPATNPVTNATAIGARAYVAQSNSLVLGSIAGVNNATANVNVGIGTSAPQRALHLAGPNAVFRMDRTIDSASFMLVRVTPAGAILKSFVVGTTAAGVNNGEFIIQDMGVAVAGAGVRRMTINNAGNAAFTGSVTAPSFIETSSLRFKSNVRTFENALDTVNRLRGVRFDWKDSGRPAVGLIAEEVDKVVPELVAHDENGGAASGVNYANLVAVLVEAVKEQQQTIERQQKAILAQERTNDEQRAAFESLKAEVETLKALLQR